MGVSFDFMAGKMINKPARAGRTKLLWVFLQEVDGFVGSGFEKGVRFVRERFGNALDIEVFHSFDDLARACRNDRLHVISDSMETCLDSLHGGPDFSRFHEEENGNDGSTDDDGDEVGGEKPDDLSLPFFVVGNFLAHSDMMTNFARGDHRIIFGKIDGINAYKPGGPL